MKFFSLYVVTLQTNQKGHRFQSPSVQTSIQLPTFSFYLLMFTMKKYYYNDRWNSLIFSVQKISSPTHLLHPWFLSKPYISKWMIPQPYYWPNQLRLQIDRLLLCRGVDTRNTCPGYDTKQSDGMVPLMLELWGIQSTPSLPLLPGPLWPRVVEPVYLC